MKMKLSWGIVVMFLLVAAPIVMSAQPTHQFVKQYMSPLYREAMDPNTNYSYTLTIDTPDGISEVVSAMLTLQVWHNPTIRYYVWVNGQTCNTQSFLVHTTYANAGEGTVYFDCSNVITGEGTYNIVLRTDDDTGASTFWADITYSNRPRGTADVHGTEYSPGDDAKVWLQLLDADGEYVIDGACQVDIYTPNNNELIEKGAMTNALHDGIYYYDLKAPQEQGVYPAIARCYYDVLSTPKSVSAFALTTGIIDAGDYTKTWVLDDDEHKIKQDAGVLDFQYTIGNMCGTNISELFLTGVSVIVNAKWKDSPINDDIRMSFYNYTASAWQQLPNKIVSPNDRVTVTNFIETNNVTKSGVVGPSGSMLLRFQDTLTSGTDKKIEVDFVQATCDQYTNPEWQEIKGSSELHITSEDLWVTTVETGQIFNDTWPGEFHYNFTVSSQASKNTTEPVRIELPTPFPCHHVQSLEIDGVEYNWTGEQPYAPLKAGCNVNWEMDLAQGANYDGHIVSENYFKEIERSWITKSNIEYDIISIACENYQEANGLPDYEIPQTTTPTNYDNYYDVCQQFLDQYYHWNYTYYNEFQTIQGTFTADEMKSLDEMWTHMINIVNDLDSIAKAIMNGMQTGADYSVAVLNDPYPPTNPQYTIYWANLSTSYLNFKQLYAMTIGAINVSVDTSEIASRIWNYSDRQLTDFNFAIGVNTTEIANAVWTNPVRTLTAFDFLVGLNTTALSDIWSYVTRGLTEPVQVDWETGAEYVWNSTTRGLTEAVNANVDWETGALYTWNSTSRELTAIQWDHENAATYVWNSTTRELTAAPFDPQLIANATWNYADRQLTAFSFTVDANVDGALIGEYVWNTTTRGLTEQADVDWATGALYIWNATTRELTAIPIDPSLIADYVWNSTTRTLTEAPVNVTQIAQAVWAFTNRELTYLDWQTGSDYVWNNSNRQLSDFQFVVNATINNSQLVFDVWSYGTRELTGAPFDPDAIANSTWNYANRSLTEFTFTVDTTLNESEVSTLTQDQVWSYFNRSLTESVSVDTNSTVNVNTTEISDDVWSYFNRTLTSAPFNPSEISNAVWNDTLSPARYTHGVDLT